MNRQITQLFGVIVVLFAVLVAFTTWWTVIAADDLEENSANRRPLIEEQRVPRGLIFARDGRTVLARSARRGSGRSTRYVRDYPHDSLFSHVVGYSFVEFGRAGLEKSRNEELAGERNEFSSIADELFGAEREGKDIQTTLDAQAQRVARDALADRRGSVVAIEPQSGRVRVMTSVPDFDPNQVVERRGELQFFNRATQARYAPGSTMKVVTAAAALDTGDFDPGSVVDGNNGKRISGVPLQNFGGQDFGPVSLTEALTNSVNTAWATVGESLGKDTMFRYMNRFGFNADPPLDYPRDEMTPSGIFRSPTSDELLDEDDRIDIGRASIGQERLQVTPFQMAMVAAAVGNGGKLMEPRLVERVNRRDGRLEEEIEPTKAADVMSAKAAGDLAGMMSKVVEEGSGTAGALQGIQVAGKTGTAEAPPKQCGGVSQNQPWFIAFAPVDEPRIAVAVTVECGGSGTGGEVAAPIAARVMQELLSG
jgi:peptidoglycan glycosyltransferase